MEKLGYTMEEAARAVSGVGRTKLYQEAKEGRLKLTKIGRNTIITAEELRRWLKEREAESNPTIAG